MVYGTKDANPNAANSDFNHMDGLNFPLDVNTTL